LGAGLAKPHNKTSGMMNLLAQFFQLIKTGSALSNMREQLGKLSVGWLQRKFPKDFAPWTVDALRIWKVFMHDTVKCLKQLSFNVHPEQPVEHGAQS